MLTYCPWAECPEEKAEGWMVQGRIGLIGWQPLCVSPDRETAESRAKDFASFRTRIVPAKIGYTP